MSRYNMQRHPNGSISLREPTPTTHGGATASVIPIKYQLRRSVMCAMLGEDNFYEDGVELKDRIAQLVPQLSGQELITIVKEAKDKMKLRHVPMFIVREMARHPKLRPFVREGLRHAITRADEPGEFLAMYMCTDAPDSAIAASVKKGLADAFQQFDEYQLSKYS